MMNNDSFNPKSIVLHNERASLFKKEYSSALDDYYMSAFKYGRKKIEHEFNKWLKQLPKDSLVLDAGCGTGYFLERMQKAPITSMGVDLSQNMLKNLKQSYPDICVQRTDVQQLPFKDHSFDAIISVEVIRYFKNRNSFLKELYRVLKPNGQLFVTAAPLLSTNFYGFYNHACQWLGLEKILSCPQSFETKQSLRNRLRKEGFQDLSIKGYFFGPYFMLDKVAPSLTPKILKKMESIDDYFSKFDFLKNFTNHFIAVAKK